MKSTVVAVLVAVALGLAGNGSTLAAGKLGGASQIDRCAYATSVEAAGGKVGGSMDRLARLGGKLGAGTGDD